jgi:hypothetical protein
MKLVFSPYEKYRSKWVEKKKVLRRICGHERRSNERKEKAK